MAIKMKRLVQGSLVRIPLLHSFGFAYAKYLCLPKIKDTVPYPDALKVYDFKTNTPVENKSELELNKYLISPILVAGSYRGICFCLYIFGS